MIEVDTDEQIRAAKAHVETTQTQQKSPVLKPLRVEDMVARLSSFRRHAGPGLQ